jgi:hypothetical protein
VGGLLCRGAVVRGDERGVSRIEDIADVDDDLACQRVSVLANDRYGSDALHGEDDDLAARGAAGARFRSTRGRRTFP